MKYGIGNLSIAPLRAEASDKSELVTQLLYGEHFKILEKRKKWSFIQVAFDRYKGWIDNKQFQVIDEETYDTLNNSPLAIASDLVDFVSDASGQLQPICLGSHISSVTYLDHSFDGNYVDTPQRKELLINTALMFLNSPYLWGGKTPFGIDCSGFTQTVYKLHGQKLLRDARQQATQGEALSFIEESEAGDLAFFDNDEGNITHVGIIMPDNYIIHAHGKVRIDRLDHSGIYNRDERLHTHRLRVIKRIF